MKISVLQVAATEGRSEYQLRKDVVSTLKTMGHTFDIAAVRRFGFLMPKIMKQIFDKIYVHKSGIEKVSINKCMCWGDIL